MKEYFKKGLTNENVFKKTSADYYGGRRRRSRFD